MNDPKLAADLPPPGPALPELRLPAHTTTLLRNRWVQLAAGVVAMVAVANLQYGWTLFVNPIHDKHGWNKTDIQVAFTLFVLTATWLTPIKAFLADRFGPGWLVFVGGLLVGLSWAVNSAADSLAALYAGQILAGLGEGVVYGVSMGSALKWFPDRRGLAAGLTAAAFGGGAALTVEPIYATIKHAGYEAAFLWFGLGQGAVVLFAALIMRPPRPGELPPAATTAAPQPRRDLTPVEMLQTPVFWLLYAMFTMVATGGLMMVAHLAQMARDFGVADRQLSLLGLTVLALPFALQVDHVLNGLTRPFFGWISDHIGREKTMCLAFTLEGCAILLLLTLAHIPVCFVLLAGLSFFAWGEIYSLFPAVCGDLFGRKYATTNYALLYTAKGTAALLVPLGSALKEATGSWLPIFALAVAFDWLTALLALFVLRPLRRRASQPHTAEVADQASR
jgi:OFA family oxalate/formate antiporter-like MFS transporter